MGTSLNQRPNHVFLSHSSRDKNPFVDGLNQWLTRQAGLKVWFDRGLASGYISENLGGAIDTCRAAVIVLSNSSVKSPWVKSECERLHKEWADYRGDFRIATVRLDPVEAPGLLESFKHIDVTDNKLTAEAGALLMETLFGGRDSALGRPVYVSRGWRETERPASDRISETLKGFGLKLLCDWVDQAHYDLARVREIMGSTGGFVAIVPHRGNGATSGYIIKEILLARELGLPTLIFVEEGVVLKPEWALDAAAVYDVGIEKTGTSAINDMFGGRIEEFAQAWKKPVRGEHVFLGHSLEESINDYFALSRRMLSRITGLTVESGGQVTGSEAQNDIVRLIRDAELCVIDITNLTYQGLPEKIDFAMNSCIEAGIALGTGKDRNLYLTCRKPRRTPPFMFRNRQVWFYADHLELVGSLRQIAALHRRMVL